MSLKNHDLVELEEFKGIRYELRPAKTPEGTVAEGLHNAWIWLDNPKQFNSYTTDMVKSVILAFRKASNERSVNAIVFTAVGDKAFCTGGNTKEYAEYYAGNPQEYMQYMRLFNDMVTHILIADKPVICRVNGMRIAGGQEIGMACDFTVASDLARFGQAGPKHGSAPVGGSTDFLPLYVGIERAMWSGALCETWTAYQAKQFGLIHDVVPVLKIDGRYVPNPLVVTDRYLDDMGRVVYGLPREGDDLGKGKELMKKGQIDLGLLDHRAARTAAERHEKGKAGGAGEGAQAAPGRNAVKCWFHGILPGFGICRAFRHHAGTGCYRRRSRASPHPLEPHWHSFRARSRAPRASGSGPSGGHAPRRS